MIWTSEKNKFLLVSRGKNYLSDCAEAKLMGAADICSVFFESHCICQHLAFGNLALV
ncbi:hypothetical protein L345_15559, partial [Ophiophagus hannah]